MSERTREVRLPEGVERLLDEALEQMNANIDEIAGIIREDNYKLTVQAVGMVVYSIVFLMLTA